MFFCSGTFVQIFQPHVHRVNPQYYTLFADPAFFVCFIYVEGAHNCFGCTWPHSKIIIPYRSNPNWCAAAAEGSYPQYQQFAEYIKLYYYCIISNRQITCKPAGCFGVRFNVGKKLGHTENCSCVKLVISKISCIRIKRMCNLSCVSLICTITLNYQRCWAGTVIKCAAAVSLKFTTNKNYTLP